MFIDEKADFETIISKYPCMMIKNGYLVVKLLSLQKRSTSKIYEKI